MYFDEEFAPPTEEELEYFRMLSKWEQSPDWMEESANIAD